MFKLFRFIRDWFTGPEAIQPNCVDDDDPMVQEAVARAFNTGNIVIGNRNDDGSWTFEELK